MRDGVLHVTPDEAGTRRPFIARANLAVPGPAMATLRLRSPGGGGAGFAWRTEGQKDFPPAQRVSVDVAATEKWQDVQAEIPARGRIIHIRVLLPEGECSIGRIGLTGTGGQSAKTWHFPESRPKARVRRR